MSEFLSMGGYGAFIWTAYGIAALLMIALLVQSIVAARHAERQAAALRLQSPRRRRRQEGDG